MKNSEKNYKEIKETINKIKKDFSLPNGEEKFEKEENKFIVKIEKNGKHTMKEILICGEIKANGNIKIKYEYLHDEYFGEPVYGSKACIVKEQSGEIPDYLSETNLIIEIEHNNIYSVISIYYNGVLFWYSGDDASLNFNEAENSFINLIWVAEELIHRLS